MVLVQQKVINLIIQHLATADQTLTVLLYYENRDN